MSSGLECHYIEVMPNEWWYLLESEFGSKNAWDWREEATAYGPFTTEDDARQHLRDNHANPGGSVVMEYVEGFEPDDVLTKLMEDAKRRPVEHRRYGRW